MKETNNVLEQLSILEEATSNVNTNCYSEYAWKLQRDDRQNTVDAYCLHGELPVIVNKKETIVSVTSKILMLSNELQLWSDVLKAVMLDIEIEEL